MEVTRSSLATVWAQRIAGEYFARVDFNVHQAPYADSDTIWPEPYFTRALDDLEAGDKQLVLELAESFYASEREWRQSLLYEYERDYSAKYGDAIEAYAAKLLYAPLYCYASPDENLERYAEFIRTEEGILDYAHQNGDLYDDDDSADEYPPLYRGPSAARAKEEDITQLRYEEMMALPSVTPQVGMRFKVLRYNRRWDSFRKVDVSEETAQIILIKGGLLISRLELPDKVQEGWHSAAAFGAALKASPDPGDLPLLITMKPTVYRWW